jgi:bifunctional non-homologous end joining protein LigD
VKAWAKAFCDDLAAEMPDRFTSNMAKAKRKGRIFLDYLRNQRGATAVMPYSVRARPGAPVAITISWAQLVRSTAPGGWSAADVAAVLRQGRKPWPEVAAKPLPDR